MFGKKFAGEELCNEDQDGINRAAPHCGHPTEQPGERTQNTGASIDREHPQGGLAHKLPFSPTKGRKRSKYNFKAPAQEAAFTKVSQ